MMKSIRMVAGLLAGAVVVVASPPQSDGDVERVRELLERSGTRTLVEGVATQIEALWSLAQMTGDPDEQAAGEAAAEVLRESFTEELLYQRAERELLADADEPWLDDALTWWRSAAGERVRTVQDSSWAREYDGLGRFWRELDEHPPSEPREELIRRLDEAKGSSRLSIEIRLAMYETMRRVMIAPMLGDEAAATARDNAESMRGLLESTVPEASRMGLLFLYRELDDGELDGLVSFWESASGKDFRDAIERAFLASVRASGEDAGRGLAELSSDSFHGLTQRFADLGFEMTPPSRPWFRLDPASLWDGAVVGFVSAVPRVYFMGFAEETGGDVDEPHAAALARAAEEVSQSLRDDATTFRPLDEDACAVVEPAGKLLVTEVEMNDNVLGFVDCVLVRRPYRYRLMAYAVTDEVPIESLRARALELFSGFRWLER